MTKSRSWGLWLAPSVAIATPAAAQSVADTLIERQRQELRDGARLDCPPGDAGDEIVICARRQNESQSPRSLLPYAAEPGRRIRGEGLTDQGGCIRLCEQPLRVDVFEAVGLVGRAIRNLQGRGD
jgi:hypothetical protein